MRISFLFNLFVKLSDYLTHIRAIVFNLLFLLVLFFGTHVAYYALPSLKTPLWFVFLRGKTLFLRFFEP